MKVDLKVTVYDRIVADIEKAHRNNREVDFIAVTREEYRELHRDLRADSALTSDLVRFGIGEVEPAKATFQVRSFEFTGDPRTSRPMQGRHLQVPSHEEFMGKPLFVVPPEYMPR